LTQALTQVVQQGETILANREANVAAGTKGFYIEFTLPEAQADIVDKLENRRGKFPIELVNVRAADAGQVFATVFVPEKQKDYYLKKVAAYRDEDSVKEKIREDGTVEEVRKPKNQLLVASIETARLAVARSFYTDQPDLFPAPGQAAWWEIWLRKGTRPAFDTAALALELGVREHSLEFAEREVVIARSTPEQLGRVVAHTDSVAEIRLARDTPSFFMGMHGAEQRAWSADLAGRLVLAPTTPRRSAYSILGRPWATPSSLLISTLRTSRPSTPDGVSRIQQSSPWRARHADVRDGALRRPHGGARWQWPGGGSPPPGIGQDPARPRC
jgi:hypothetical protein